ncbi:phage distal tail protein [Streptomyces sp. NPDC127040]|uniref:phage distal tail protein n=1 Tax=Streptomyces sp. NPDC127040 TaxID=3347116 RepID=UPI0036557BFC
MPYIPGSSLGGRRVDLGPLSLGTVDDAGTAWHLQELEGWDSAEVRSEHSLRESDHGGWASPVYLGIRPISIGGKVEAADLSALDAAVEQLLAAVALTDTTLVVYEGIPKQVTVRRSGKPLVRLLTDRVAEYSLMVTAADPRRYSTTLQTQSTALPSTTGGLTEPVTLPILISTTTVAGSITLVNEGTIATRPTFTVEGPVTNPTITVQYPDGTVRALLYSSALEAGDQLVIDTDLHSAVLNGTTSRRLYLSGQWAEIPPGTSVEVGWYADTYDAAALLTGTVRSAWM